MFDSSARKFGVFMILVVFQIYATHWILTWSLRRVTISDHGSFNRAMLGMVNADIVVSGSSRAYRHYDPRIISQITGLKTYNLGRNASQIDVQLGVLKGYLRMNRKPRIVVQNLDLQSFLLTKEGDVYDPSQYVPFLAIPEINSTLASIETQFWKWEQLPLYVYAAKDTTFGWLLGLRQLVGWSPKESCFNGFSPMDRSWTHEFDRFMRTHPQGVRIGIEPGGVSALREMADICRSQGIRLVLVYSPQYHEMVGLTLNRSEIFSNITQIASEFNLEFFDYTDSSLTKQRDHFYNAQHLNAEGAALFSKDFALKLLDEPVSGMTTEAVTQ